MENKSNKKIAISKKTIIILSILIIITICIIGGLFFWMLNNNNSKELKKESNVITNEKNYKSFQDMQAKSDSSKIGIKMNKNIVFQTSQSTGNIMLENTSSNKNSFSISLCIKDTGEEIYKSGLIEYGTRIDEIKLDKVIEKGKYEAIVYITAYDTDNNQRGTTGLNVNVNILN